MNTRQKQVAVVVVIAIILWFVIAPPHWWLNLTKQVDLTDAATTGEQLVQEYGCANCHIVGSEGALKAPNLNTIMSRLDDVSVRLWLRNPRAVKGNTAMPNFHLSDSEIDAIVAYLELLNNRE